MTEPAGAPVAVLPLRRSQFWSAGLLAATALTVALGLGLAPKLVTHFWQGQTPEGLWVNLFYFGVVFIATSAAVARRLYVRTRDLPPLTFYDAYFTLPPNTEAVGVRAVAYTDILGFSLRGSAFRPQLLIESRHHIFLIAADAFVDPHGMQLAVELLTQQIRLQPRGPSIFEDMDRRRDVAQAALTLRPIVTQALLGLMIVFFANQILTGSMANPLGAISWGADATALVHRGELFRLVAANFLHRDPVHIFFNGLALYYLGMVLERLLGRERFLLVFLVSGLAATSASALWPAGAASLGASGAVFGLLGALAVTNVRFRTQLPLGFRQPLRWWVLILAINAALPILLPRIDVVAHAVGFVVGIALTFLLVGGWKEMRPARQAGPALRGITAIFALIYVAGLVQAVAYAARFDDAKEQEVARVLVEDPHTDGEQLNALAWGWATTKDASKGDLDVALKAAERAIALEPKAQEIRDTLATVYYRRGDLDDAIRTQEEVVAAVPDEAVYASQLLRFLDARRKKTGRPRVAQALASARLNVALERKSDAWSLDLLCSKPTGSWVRLAILVDDGSGTRLGLLQVTAPLDGEKRVIRLANDVPASKNWPAGSAAVLLDVAPAPEGATKLALRFAAMAPSIAALP